MTKKVTKVFAIMGVSTAVVAAGLMLFSPEPVKSSHQYAGTLYVAGMGGHFAKVDVNIDPSEKQPIKINAIDRVEIGDSSTHPTHDPRIDAKDSNTMYWSTY